MEIEKSELRCWYADPLPSTGVLAVLAVLLVAAALVFGIGLGQIAVWVAR